MQTTRPRTATPLRVATGAMLLGSLPWRLAGLAMARALEGIHARGLANAHGAVAEDGWEELRLTTELAQLSGPTRTPLAAAR
jgi:hypothetical protein